MQSKSWLILHLACHVGSHTHIIGLYLYQPFCVTLHLHLRVTNPEQYRNT